MRSYRASMFVMYVYTFKARAMCVPSSRAVKMEEEKIKSKGKNGNKYFSKSALRKVDLKITE